MWAPGGLVLAIVAAVIAVLVGAPVWILLVVAAVPAVLALRTRHGTLVALGATWLGGLALLLATMMATAVLRVQLLPGVVVVVGAVGIAACVVWMRAPRVPLPSRGRVVAFASALTGPLVWLGVSVPTAVFDPVAGRSWAMHGDAANYLLFARGILASSGVVVGPAGNPVPLPSGLFAIYMAPGRDGVASARLLWHDLGSYEALQIGVIATCCLFAGLLAVSIASTIEVRGILLVVVSVCGSLLPLSWTLTTNAIAYGYFDAQLSLPCVFACLLLARLARGHAVVVAVVLTVGCTVLLSVWTPLVLVPLAALAVVVATEWRVLVHARRSSLVALGLGAAQLVAYGLAVTLPDFLEQSKFLAAHGAAFTYTHSLFPSLGAMTILLSLLAWRRAGPGVALSTIVLPVALAVGLVFLLFESRTSTESWSYFPSKFEWLSISILLVVALGLVPVVLASLTTGWRLQASAALSVIAMTAVVTTSTPAFVSGYDWANPLAWIAQNDNTEGGKAAAARILALADVQHPRLYWLSGVPSESYIDYWLIEVASRSVTNNALRKYAYAHNESSPGQLCTILGLMHPAPTVITRSGSVEATLAAACPGTPARVQLLSGARTG